MDFTPDPDHLAIAEGVDNPRRLQQLRRLGFDLAQGNVIAAPVEAGQLVDLLLAVAEGR